MANSSEELEQLRAENARLKAYINDLNASGDQCTTNGTSDAEEPPKFPTAAGPWDGFGHGLSKEEVARYSRQIILPSFGVQGTLNSTQYTFPSLLSLAS